MNSGEVKFNTIGIDDSLDYPRIRKLLSIGAFSALIATIGDMLLGYGRREEGLSGIAGMFSAYTGASDQRLFVVSLLGLFGMMLEGLCFFGIYRMMAAKSPRHAHNYRTGIFGYVIFGPCGFHVPVCAALFLYKKLQLAGAENIAETMSTYVRYFMLPAFILFWIFFLILEVTQISAFAKGMTPYPRWCLIFSLPVGMAIAKAFNIFGNQPWVNGIDCAWIHIGCLWTFLGLLFMSKGRSSGENDE